MTEYLRLCQEMPELAAEQISALESQTAELIAQVAAFDKEREAYIATYNDMVRANARLAAALEFYRDEWRAPQGVAQPTDALRRDAGERARAALSSTPARGAEGEVDVNDQKTLGDELPKVMARVRDEIMPAYRAIGPAGMFALSMMRHDLDCAARAMAEGDVVEMLRYYKALSEYKT